MSERQRRPTNSRAHIDPPPHSHTHSLSFSHTHSLTRSLAHFRSCGSRACYSLTHSLTHSLAHSLGHRAGGLLVEKRKRLCLEVVLFSLVPRGRAVGGLHARLFHEVATQPVSRSRRVKQDGGRDRERVCPRIDVLCYCRQQCAFFFFFFLFFSLEIVEFKDLCRVRPRSRACVIVGIVYFFVLS